MDIFEGFSDYDSTVKMIMMANRTSLLTYKKILTLYSLQWSLHDDFVMINLWEVQVQFFPHALTEWEVEIDQNDNEYEDCSSNNLEK